MDNYNINNEGAPSLPRPRSLAACRRHAIPLTPHKRLRRAVWGLPLAPPPRADGTLHRS